MFIADDADSQVALRLGGQDLAVRVGGKYVAIAKQYDVQISMLVQPAAFSLTLGSAELAATILQRFPIGTEFELVIGGNVQFVGVVDGFVASTSTSGSSIAIRGRDRLGAVVDQRVRVEESMTNATVRELAELVLERALLGKDWELQTDDSAGRALRTGNSSEATVASDSGPSPGFLTRSTEAFARVIGVEIERDDAEEAPPEPTIPPDLQFKLGESYYTLLKRELDRLGLFLWCSATGAFVISRPDPTQKARYSLRRVANGGPGSTTIISSTFRNETTPRHNIYEVHCRAGGGEETVTNIVGRYLDREMFAFGLAKAFAREDDTCTTEAQAEFLARRMCAEARRSGWCLEYTVSGHTTTTANGSVATWAPDTVVDVSDEVLGIRGPHYIEGVRFAGGPNTTTTLTLMRPEDVVFGEEMDGPPLGGFAATDASEADEGFLTSLSQALGGYAKEGLSKAAKKRGTINDAFVIDVLQDKFKLTVIE